MERDQEILRSVEKAFADCPRPEHFTNHTHCEECAEHDAALQPFTPQTLTFEALGHAGWGPLPFMTPQAIAHFMPGLVRLVLDGEPEEFVYDPARASNHVREWIGPLVLNALRRDGPDNALMQHCLPAQKLAIAGFLGHLLETRAAIIDVEGEADTVLALIAQWSAPASADHSS